MKIHLMILTLGLALSQNVRASDDLDLLLQDLEDPDRARVESAMELNRCGIALLAECAKADQKKPVLISPFSIDSAFAMLSLGASGKAKEEIDKTLGLPDDLTKFANDNKFLSSSKFPKLLTSNSIWVDKRFPLSKSYSDLVGNHFPMSLFDFDNTKQVESADRMNQFVSEKTCGMIRNVLRADDICPSKSDEDLGTGLVLINTLYFKGKWREPFEKADTLHRQDFNDLDGTARYVDLMTDTRTVLYGEGDDWQAIALPYRGGKFDFVAVLPTPALNVGTLLGRLCETNAFQNLLNGCSNSLVHIKLPKLDFEYKASLKERLEDLGMKRPFKSDISSFPSITEGKDGKYVECVDKVIHATRIKMNEEETEAAAATAIMMCCMAGCARAPEPPIPEFAADHPFLGFIVERTTGLVLFAGVVRGIGTDPHAATDLQTMEGREQKRRDRFATQMKRYRAMMGGKDLGALNGWLTPDDDGLEPGEQKANDFVLPEGASSERSIGINALGDWDDAATYGNENRYLLDVGNHISGEGDSTNDLFIMRLDMKVKCSSCGDEHFLRAEDVTMRCPACDGQGVAECWWCGKHPCPNCDGSGWRRYCRRCHGEGRVWRWWGWKTDCPDCRK